MKYTLITTLLLLLTISTITQAEENIMHFTTEGTVFPCMNEETSPWGTCFMVEDNRWGQQTPLYDPKPGEKITVTFTFTRYLNPDREHEDMFYVSNMRVHNPFEKEPEKP